MANVEDFFRPARNSIDWANDAISELNAEIHRFLDGDVAEIVTEIDPNTGENVQKLRLRKAMPSTFGRKATEALTTTRHAFDQAIFAALSALAGRPLKKSVYYPWAQSPTDLDHLLKGARGIDERLWDTIAAHEPYPRSDGHAGGDDTIRTLAQIANDKHTIGLRFGATISNLKLPPIHLISGKQGENVYFRNPQWDAEKNEAELVRWKGNVKMDGEYHCVFEVAFSDSRLSEAVNVITGLKAFSSKCSEVTESLHARCLEPGF